MSRPDILLDLFTRHVWVCGQEMVEAGVGYRYSARIYDLRKAGYVVKDRPCRRHEHQARMLDYALDDGQMEMGL